MSRQIKFIFVISLLSLAISGCASNYKPYQTNLTHNIEVKSNTEAIRATLEIYNIKKECNAEYQGVLELDEEIITLGVPDNQPSHLVVGFSERSLLGHSSRYFYSEFTLIPRSDYHYLVDVYYIDDIYDVLLYEINQSSGKKQKLNIKEMRICPDSMPLLRY